jgi:hypothetical protein
MTEDEYAKSLPTGRVIAYLTIAVIVFFFLLVLGVCLWLR